MKKTIAMILALVLVLLCAVGATLAWMNDKTEEKTNTFTMGGGVDIGLEEHAYDPEDPDTITDVEIKEDHNYPLVPGTVYAKDPTVTVKAGSEDCYLFVEVIKTPDLDKFVVYELDLTGWTPLDGQNGVYWRTVQKADADQTFHMLVGDKVTVKNAVENTGAKVDISFQAYAIQKANIADAATAWAEFTK